MKKKAILIIISIIIATTFIILLIKNNNHDIHDIPDYPNNYDNQEIIEIRYTYNGGYGTIADTSNKTILFTPNGEVKISNDYNSYTETFNINQSKYIELNNFITARLSLFDEKAIEDNGILDGSYSSIFIKLKSNQNKEIGGYMIKNPKFGEIENKIFEIVDYKRLRQYKSKIETDE